MSCLGGSSSIAGKPKANISVPEGGSISYVERKYIYKDVNGVAREISVEELSALNLVDYQDILDMSKAGNAIEGGTDVIKNNLVTCTIFDPSIFLRNSVNIFFHISPTRLKNPIMGNYLDFALKIAHRGNTGSHMGKRKLYCVPEK